MLKQRLAGLKRLCHGPLQLVGRDGLLKERMVGVEAIALEVAAHHHDRHFWVEGACSHDEFQATHSGHLNVRDEEIERLKFQECES